MTSLTEKKCQSCEGIGRTMTKEEAQAHIKEVLPWKLSPDFRAISRDYVMKNFVAAVELIDKIAAIAESENHHPDIHLTGYRNLKVDLSTHALGGLTENDFIVAAKINALPAKLK